MNWAQPLLPAIDRALKERKRRDHRRRIDDMRRGRQKRSAGRPRKP
jgi:hypothetical protein